MLKLRCRIKASKLKSYKNLNLHTANGFWGGRFDRTYIDFNPSNRHSNCYRKHEQETVWTTCTRGGTRFVYSPCVISAWQIRLQFSIKGLPPAWPWSGINHTAWPWTGCAPELHFHCSVPQFNVFVAHDPDVDIPTSQWTWPCLNYS